MGLLVRLRFGIVPQPPVRMHLAGLSPIRGSACDRKSRGRPRGAGPDLKKKTVKVDAAYVRKQLADIVKDQDLSRYIL